jgi:hypothetical protein
VGIIFLVLEAVYRKAKNIIIDQDYLGEVALKGIERKIGV